MNKHQDPCKNCVEYWAILLKIFPQNEIRRGHDGIRAVVGDSWCPNDKLKLNLKQKRLLRKIESTYADGAPTGK